MTNEPFNDDLLAELSAYVDDTLTADEQRDLEARLESDASLRAELAAYRRIDELVRTSAAAVPEIDSTDFLAEARRRRSLKLHAQPARRWVHVLRPLAAAAVIVIVVTAALIWRPKPSNDRSNASESMVALVHTPAASTGESDGASSWVEFTRALPESALHDVGPAPITRTLIVSVAGEKTARVTDTDRSTEPDSDEEAGYF
jgi:hypothetical protein